ncbi:MAG TPA: PEP-CTERM sorting domain-containing protein [Bryobacteraceae bacterium]|jgi:hypothetical protein|nr:PEP-CTERM sorting domain-containing protein [Bryobacteraceae bacterium]
MKRILGLSTIVMLSGIAAQASSLSCSLYGADGTTVISNACVSQSQIFTSDPVDWLAALGPADKNPTAGPWQTSNNGVNITLSSVGLLQRAQNTVFAWDGSEWNLPDFVANDTVNTFQGHFGAPSSPTSTPIFGDALVGVVGPSALTINFSAPILSAGFMISSKTLSNFNATIQAFDSSNNLLGTYSIVAQGLGGLCAGLGNYPNPQPCNNAPFLGFLGQNPQAQISSLVVSTNDTNGMFLDSLFVQDSQAVPEPSVIFLMGSGLCVIGLFRRRNIQ